MNGSGGPEFYLLTHAHADHLKGLDVSSFGGGVIYCSPITRSVLRNNDKYKGNSAHLRDLPLNKRHAVPYGSTTLTISLIDSNHCAGSVMFLLESHDKSVLITGDIRAESWWVDQLPRLDLLIPYTSGVKKLDMIYLVGHNIFIQRRTIHRDDVQP